MNRLHRWYCRSDRWAAQLQGKILPWSLGSHELGDDVLEIGPGPGLATDVLRTRAARLTAVEIDPALAESLRTRLAGTNATVLQGDATELALPDESFSGAVSLTMLHHVPSPAAQDRLFSEIRRVLRPGGRFVGSDSRPSSALFRFAHIADTMVCVDPATLEARLLAAGFSAATVDARPHIFRFHAMR